MKRIARIAFAVAAGGILAATLVGTPVFLLRAPVLVVTDPLFAAIYGEDRIRARQRSASRALFRRVIPVSIADDAGPDILIAAVAVAAAEPFAVMFPARFSTAAERFHAEFPDVRVVLFRGAAPASGFPEGGGNLSVFGTDRETDIFRAGLLAGIIGRAVREREPAAAEDGEEAAPAAVRETHVLIEDRFADQTERALFLGAATGMDPGSAVVFADSAEGMPDAAGVATLVLAGSGGDLLERNMGIPTILFGWIHPDLTSGDVLAVFDDSPWAKVVPAARLAGSGETSALLRSDPLIFSARISDNGVSRMLRRAAVRVPRE